MPRFAFRVLVVAAVLGVVLVGASSAFADELVKFASLPLPQAQGVGNGGQVPERRAGIQGFLTRPKGIGPFPAVVVLHSCLGFPSNRQSIGRALAGWGYVALFVDGFGTRGLRETCAVDFPEGLSDAFGALAFVAGLPYVDRTRMAVLGYSQGADTALKVASYRLPDELRFKAAAAFYPPCENEAGARLRLPTLILIGAADTVTPAAACERLASNQTAGEVQLVVYPGAGHVFDDPQFTGGKRLLGMWLQFDQQAAARSRSALREFLAAKLAK